MAHDTQVIGAISEITATKALMQNGWQVARPVVPEVYDLVAKDPVNGEWRTVQVKTARVRDDRGGSIVIYARKGNGNHYTPSDCDYIAGVLGDTVYLMECRGIGEYWSTEMSASKRWVELTANPSEGVAV